MLGIFKDERGESGPIADDPLPPGRNLIVHRPYSIRIDNTSAINPRSNA